VTGKPATGHVYHWRNNGFSEEIAIAIELAVAAMMVESPEAAARAAELGAVTVEQLRPDRDWERDETGEITGYRVPVVLRLSEEDNDPHRRPAEEGESPAETVAPAAPVSEAA
jgi:hypothetical protein